MSDPNPNVGGVDPIVGDKSGDPNQKEDKAFLNLKAEKKALAERLAEANSRAEKLEREAKERQDEVLKQQGEYKKLWEEEQKSKADLQEKLAQREKKDLALRKIDVVMKELGMPLAKPEYWNYVDLDRIPVDEATGDVDVNIARQVSTEFMAKYPELLSKKPGKAPNDAPGSAKSITYEEWAKLPLAEKRVRLKDVKK